MLADLRILPPRTAEQAAQDLLCAGFAAIADPRSVENRVARRLTLSEPPPPPPAEAAASAAGAALAGKAVAGTEALLKTLIGTQRPGPPPEPPGEQIDDRYWALRDFVGSGAGAPIDQALQAINALQQQLVKLAAAVPGAGPAPASGDDPILMLRAEASRDPQPVARWLNAMATSGAALRGGGARQQVASAFNSSSGPAELCRKAVAGRYPFEPGAADDIPLEDFARLFAPGGPWTAFSIPSFGHMSTPAVRPGAPGRWTGFRLRSRRNSSRAFSARR